MHHRTAIGMWSTSISLTESSVNLRAQGKAGYGMFCQLREQLDIAH